MNKYYTPEIEEFYVGFEIEVYNQDSSKWYPYKCTIQTIQEDTLSVYGAHGLDWMLDGEDQEHPSCRTRVKYLDREDIEEVLGVKQLKGDAIELNFQILQEDSEDFYEVDYDTDILELTVELYKEVSENRYDCYTLFIGKIKNKSEFKKLIKQLGI